MARSSVAWLLVVAAAALPAAAGERIVVGSKKFTEAVILGELATLSLRAAGLDAEHRRELGGTRVLFDALEAGQIDVYADYTGTLRLEVLKHLNLPDDRALAAALAERGILMTPPLGFNNTYALGMRREQAERLGVRTISDLRRHPELRFGFSNEFMDRADGWPGLRQRYRLPQTRVRGLDHDLAYRGLESGDLDVMDLYSTDAEIAYYDLAVLTDDRGYFPTYYAVYLYRRDRAEQIPALRSALERLAGTLDETSISRLNARVKLGGESEAEVAASFLAESLGLSVAVESAGRAARLLARTREHLMLVAVSLAAAILLAIPLGVVAAKLPRAGQLILGAVGVVQTIPALALLVFMIPLLGIYEPPALVALFLYSLLPIVRNTHSGLTTIPPPLVESALALGLSPAARLRRIELPLALPSILAGIQTAAVINVGFATLGALIGAGGYGQPILTGIRLDDVGLILEGAVPAALMALAVQGLFELAARALIPRGLRPRRGG